MKNNKYQKNIKEQNQDAEWPEEDVLYGDDENDKKSRIRKKTNRRKKPGHKNMFWDD